MRANLSALAIVAVVPAAIAAFSIAAQDVHASSPISTVQWTDWATMLTPLVLFVMGMMAKPLLENTVNAKLNEVEGRFIDMEHAAHSDIIKSIERTTGEFQHHNADGFAHPNLLAFEKVENKLDRLTIELGALRTDVAAMRARVTRPTKRKIK